MKSPNSFSTIVIMHNPIGVMLNSLGSDRLLALEVAGRLGFQWVHTGGLPEAWLAGPDRERYVAAVRNSGLRIASMFIGFDGQSYAGIPEIERTVGLVIPELRERRRAVALAYGPLARDVGAPSLSCHLGFLPPREDPVYARVVSLAKELAEHCDRHGLTLHLETGQDAAAVLGRFLQEVGSPNVGINFDPANFILYGSDDPEKAFETLASHIRAVHCKDALPADRAGQLGREAPLGEGQVSFPKLLRRLKEIGYEGPLVIEREQGSNKVEEVLAARIYLEKLLAEL